MTESGAIPRAIRRVEDRIECEWEGRPLATVSMRRLRLACRCAWCVDEMTGRQLLDPDTVPADVRADHIAPVGGYGIRVHWSDGHGSGIYTWELLQAVCQPPADGDPLA